MFGPSFVMQYLTSFLVCNRLKKKKKRKRGGGAGRFNRSVVRLLAI